MTLSSSFLHVSLFTGFLSSVGWRLRAAGKGYGAESTGHMLGIIMPDTQGVKTWSPLPLESHYYHPFFSARMRKQLGLEMAHTPTNAVFSFPLLSFPGTISCQKCVISSRPPHLTWLKFKLLPHQSVHTFFPALFQEQP